MPRKGYQQTPEHRRKCAEWRMKYLKGMKLDRLLIKRQVEGRLRRYKTHRVWNFCIPHTKATRLKISEAMKEYWKRKKKNAEGRDL